jgi:holo-ACP synthase/triphosphoribosyl-dephospho-CoA synthase
MAHGVTAELKNAFATAGERFYRDYGLRGIRGEVEDGFPSVTQAGLPALKQALARGCCVDMAGCEALLAMMAVCEDTALVHRVGYDGWQRIKLHSAQLLEQGVTRDTLERFDRELIAQNASPGGSADLLALCWLLHFLQEAVA